MPFVHLEDQGVRSFYVLNPIERPVEDHWLSENPESEPYDPFKPTLLLLHAATMSSAFQAPQIFDPRLRSQANVVAIDCRACGRTEELKGQTHISMEDTALTIIATMDELQIDAYSIFAEGVAGCRAVIWLAYKRPEREAPEIVKAIKQLPPIFNTNKDGNGDGTGTLSDEAVTIATDYFISTQPRLHPRRAEYAKYFQWRYGPGKPYSDIENFLEQGTGRNAFPPAVIKSIRVPVMIFHGEDDLIVSPKPAVDEWASLFKNVRGGVAVHHIAGAPHVISLTNSNVINRLLAAFMSRHNTPATSQSPAL